MSREPVTAGAMARTAVIVSSAIAAALLCLGSIVEMQLLAVLVTTGSSRPVALPFAEHVPLAGMPYWLALHGAASAVVALATTVLVAHLTPDRRRRVFLLCLAFGVSMPFVGAIGAGGALLLGMRRAIGQHREIVYWQFTRNPELPFTTPIGRAVDKLDGRGFAEQLMFGDDRDELYRKVLAAGRIRTSLSVEALSTAIAHPDDRIRLTAYQTLDRKVTRLNGDIQRLERSAASHEGQERSDTWLQIASNYWELLTLEQGEPVAREQLLDRAATAAANAIAVRDDNRNAHFTAGRIALRQGEPERARHAFERALGLGMPRETVLPYLAEAAFEQRDFARVADQLGALDDAFKRYPPLRQLAAQWT